jgi:predicted DCC family thiol-disulfide oxidoreductase YuxK
LVSGNPTTLFFDGQCAFCSESVRLISRLDRHGRISFSPLQGETFRSLDITGKPTDTGSLVFLHDGRLYLRSDGTLMMLTVLGGGWKVLAALGRLCPRSLRDWAYDLIARNRYRWFGTSETCGVPSAALRARLLP